MTDPRDEAERHRVDLARMHRHQEVLLLTSLTLMRRMLTDGHNEAVLEALDVLIDHLRQGIGST